MLQLKVSNSPQNKLKDENIKAYYEIDFIDNYKSHYYKTDYNEFDKIFFKYFRKTKKFNNFIYEYLINNNCQEIKRQSFLIVEEFMNLNKDYLFNDKRDYFQIISQYYQTSNKLRKINFNKFYIYYDKNLSKTIYDYVKESKTIKIKQDIKTKNTNQFSFINKEGILDKYIILRYSYLLNNLDQKLLFDLFPHLQFKNRENNVNEEDQNLFADFLEKYLIKEKVFKLKEVVSFIIIIIYIINLRIGKIFFHFFEIIMKSKLIDKKCCLRKYIYFILYFLNEKVKEKIIIKENYIKELLLYKEILSTLYSLNQQKGFYLNGFLSDLIKNFNIYQNYYDVLLTKHPILKEKNKPIIEEYNNYIFNILEEGIDYKVFIKNNACEDKGMMRDEAFVGTMEALEYKGIIKTSCRSCKMKNIPNLFFIHVPQDKSIDIRFCSIIYLYKLSNYILKKCLDDDDLGKLNKDYFTLCGNMIYYINFKEGNNNLLSRYIATSLK